MAGQATPTVLRWTAEAAGRVQGVATYDGLGIAVIEDAIFLESWGRGEIPSLDAFFRARQLLRANPQWREGLG